MLPNGTPPHALNRLFHAQSTKARVFVSAADHWCSSTTVCGKSYRTSAVNLLLLIVILLALFGGFGGYYGGGWIW